MISDVPILLNIDGSILSLYVAMKVSGQSCTPGISRDTRSYDLHQNDKQLVFALLKTCNIKSYLIVYGCPPKIPYH